jgi:hypothetical protein
VKRLSLILLAALLASPTPGMSAPPERCVRQRADYTLRQLGQSPIEFSGKRKKVRSASVFFELPPNAAQGAAGNWFVVRLHFDLFLKAKRPGFADVSALVNRRSAALAEFEIGKDRARFRWESAGAINGRERGRGRTGRPYELWLTNYAQFKSIHGGRNKLTFQVEEYEGVAVRELRVFRDSGVVVTSIPPGKLKLKVAPASRRGPVSEGKVLRLPFQLTNVGGCPARDVEIGVIYPHETVEVVGPRTVKIGVLRREARGVFAFRFVRPGTHRLLIGVNSSANHPGVVIDVPVRSSGSSRRALLFWLSGAFVAGAVVFTALWRRAAGRRSP